VSAADLEELAALRREIEEIARGAGQNPGDASGPADAMSYSSGPGGGIGGIVSSAEEKVAAIVDSIETTLAKLAPVAHFQTTCDGFTAKMVISYSGFAASVWSSGTTAELVDAHLKSLQEAYAFRTAVTAVVAAVGNAVVAISIAVGSPLTVWHAIKSVEALKSAVERLAAAVAANTQLASQSSSPV
jgi:hypothetical protein